MTMAETVGGERGNRLRVLIWGIAAFALLAPWFAMQFTSEVAWDRADFVVWGAMLLVACGAYEFAARLSGDKTYRLAVGIVLLGTFLLIWTNLAVGIIGNEENPANLMFYVPPAVALAGALIAQFKAPGMARAMVAAAVAQASAAVFALLAGWGQTFVLTGFFMLVWLLSAHLFRKAGREPLKR